MKHTSYYRDKPISLNLAQPLRPYEDPQSERTLMLLVAGLFTMALFGLFIISASPSQAEAAQQCVETTNYSYETCVFQVGR